MQLTAVARETDRVVVEPNGFTLVEEDDVAFTLSLCREVNRLYGLYQGGRMQASPQLEGGLMVSLEMLALVARTVTTGMPAMRITVAGAQLREMMSVMFDADPFSGSVDRSVRDGFRAVLAEMHAPPAVAHRSRADDARPAPPELEQAGATAAQPLPAGPESSETIGAVESTGAREEAPDTDEAPRPRRGRGLRRLLRLGAQRHQ